MMVSVRNLNVHPFKQKFLDRMIIIGPGEAIDMDFDEAHKFIGMYSPPKLDGDGNHLSEGFKMLRIEDKKNFGASPELPEVSISPLVCQTCKYTGTSVTDLGEHLKTHGETFVDEVAEELVKKKSKKGK